MQLVQFPLCTLILDLLVFGIFLMTGKDGTTLYQTTLCKYGTLILSNNEVHLAWWIMAPRLVPDRKTTHTMVKLIPARLAALTI